MATSNADIAVARLKDDRTDRDAWGILYNELWPPAFTVCFRLLGGQRELAKDATQDAFIRVMDYLPFDGITDGNDVARYLHVVCRNVCRTIISRHARERQIQVESDELEAIALHDSGSLEESEQWLLARETYEQILTLLSPMQQRVLLMKVSGFSTAEIADNLQLDRSTIRVHLFRLREKVREFLKERELE